MDTIGSAACNGFEMPDSEVRVQCKEGGGWPPQAWHKAVSFSPAVVGEGRDAMVTDTTGKLSSTTMSVYGGCCSSVFSAMHLSVTPEWALVRASITKVFRR